jgi:hypothetical protein
MLRELQAVTPALKSISLDTSLSESVRKQADAILVLAHKPTASPEFRSGVMSMPAYWRTRGDTGLIAGGYAALTNIGADELHDFVH